MPHDYIKSNSIRTSKWNLNLLVGAIRVKLGVGSRNVFSDIDTQWIHKPRAISKCKITRGV